MSSDERAFGEQLEPHRRALHAHCYRMLGSVQDAEDAVQETLLRAWRGLDRFECRSSLRSWLYSIATNVCLRMIERRPARVLPIDYGPPSDPHAPLGPPLLEATGIEPYPDAQLGLDDELAGPEGRYEQREAVELAFIAALQHLPARQRATLRSLGDQRLSAIVGRYVAAWANNDVDALVEMLTESATLSMPPTAGWLRGRDAIATSLRARPLNGTQSWRLLPTSANGQPALGVYLLDTSGAYVLHHLAVLTLRGQRIDEINAFHDLSAPQPFGLPASARR